MNASAVPSMLVENETTPDVRIEESDGGWSVRPCAPPGTGWKIADASRERCTRWRRIRVPQITAPHRAEHARGR